MPPYLRQHRTRLSPRPGRDPATLPTAPTSASVTSTCAAGVPSTGISKTGRVAQAVAAASWSAMQRLPHEELRLARSLAQNEDLLDNQAALRLKNRLAEEFREQLTFGAPLQSGRSRSAPPVTATQGRQARRQALPFPPSPCQALPAPPLRPHQPNCRLSGQQQPYPGRPLPSRRVERRRPRP